MDLATIALGVFCMLLAFLLGLFMGGQPRRYSNIRLIDKWPNAHFQFDSSMSEAEMLRFIAMAEQVIRSRSLTKAEPADDRADSSRRFWSRYFAASAPLSVGESGSISTGKKPRPAASQLPPFRNPASAADVSDAVSDVTPVLTSLSHMLALVNSGLAMNEDVHGLRMIEPLNDLSQELKELHWCIARLNGMTDQPYPYGDGLIGALGGPRHKGMPHVDHLASLNHPGTRR
nr:hypothetical protein [uncultured Pseudomonas sp.]